MTEHCSVRPVGLSGYGDGCRCTGCRAAKARYQRGYECRRLGNDRLTVSADQARSHLLWLRDNGVGPTTVSRLTGLSPSHLGKITAGLQKRILADSETMILRVSRDQASDLAVIDASLTWRRLHGLMALGWSAQFLANELGYHNRRTPPVGRRLTLVRIARAVAALCGKYGNRPGPSDASAARRRGWPVYGSWDDDLTELTDYVSSRR